MKKSDFESLASFLGSKGEKMAKGTNKDVLLLLSPLFKEEAKKAKSSKRGKMILGHPSSSLFAFFAHFCPFCFLFKRGLSSYHFLCKFLIDSERD